MAEVAAALLAKVNAQISVIPRPSIAEIRAMISSLPNRMPTH